MRVVCLSDTHGMHDRIDVPDGDLLIHAGDLTMAGTWLECQEGLQWLHSLPHKRKVFVPGNHDFAFESGHPKLLTDAQIMKIHVLIDRGVTLLGHCVYGTPWLDAVRGWAFDCTDDPHKLGSNRRAIPQSVDILVTHCPPHGVLDRCPSRWPGDPELAGCKMLPRGNPKLHVFGHIHEGAGVQGRCVNASICTRDYEPTNPPIVIDL